MHASATHECRLVQLSLAAAALESQASQLHYSLHLQPDYRHGGVVLRGRDTVIRIPQCTDLGMYVSIPEFVSLKKDCRSRHSGRVQQRILLFRTDYSVSVGNFTYHPDNDTRTGPAVHASPVGGQHGPTGTVARTSLSPLTQRAAVLTTTRFGVSGMLPLHHPRPPFSPTPESYLSAWPALPYHNLGKHGV